MKGPEDLAAPGVDGRVRLQSRLRALCVSARPQLAQFHPQNTDHLSDFPLIELVYVMRE
jgi:hypothetical protein